MRSLVLATISALALGLAAPVYAQGNAGTDAANPATATPSTAAPSNQSAQPAIPQTGTGAGTESTQGATNSSSQYGTSPYTASTGAASGQSGAQHMTRGDIRQAQERLRAEGLYRGRLDGREGPKTRAAVRKFQKKNGLPVIARLDESTLNELTGGMNQNMGQGSSMPPPSATNMTPPASTGAGTNGSTSTGTTTGTSYK